MPGVDYDDDASTPHGHSRWIIGAALAAVLALIFFKGVIALLVLVLVAVVIGVVVGLVYSAVKLLRGEKPEHDREMVG
jgi:hypothetical protein